MKKLIFLFLILISALAVFSNFLIMKSLRGQYILDQPNSFTLKQVDSLLPFYPTASATSMPLDLYRAKASFKFGNLKSGYFFLHNAKKQNPYTFYPELILSKFHLNMGLLDSALYYGKKSFIGWPKNFDHFQNYLKVLSIYGDTLSIIDAAKFVGPTVSSQEKYIKVFKEEYNNAKLKYLITNYPDAEPVTTKLLKGKWVRAYNFENSKTIIDSTISYFFNNNDVLIKSPSDNLDYNYNIKLDSLNFYFKGQEQPFYKIHLMYSDSLHTLIFNNIKVPNGYQDQYFKKVNDNN